MRRHREEHILREAAAVARLDLLVCMRVCGLKLLVYAPLRY
jgi:hypothetical protein